MDVPSSKRGDHSRCRLQTDRPTQDLLCGQGDEPSEVQIVRAFQGACGREKGLGFGRGAVHGLSLVWGTVIGKTGEAADMNRRQRSSAVTLPRERLFYGCSYMFHLSGR